MPVAKIWLNTKSPRKTGEVAVYIMVHIEYKSLKFNTGVVVHPDNWDEKKIRIRGVSKTVKDDNLIIEKAMAQMNDIFVRYRLQNAELTPELLKNEWKNPARRIDFYAFFEEAINERKKEIRKQTWKNHWSEIHKLKLYKPKLAFSEINANLLEQYKRWLKTERKNDINSIYASMKIIKTYINIAIRKGIIITNPFELVKTKQVKPERVFLTVAELQELWELYQAQTLPAHNQKILRHFLFMSFTGLRISDFFVMARHNINGNLLVYYPIKTKGVKKTPVKVPLSSYAMRLIADENSPDELLFHAITEQKMNEAIKKIVNEIGCYKPITNHSARHTFATVWLSKTHDLAALQVLLGHSKITDTMIYVHVTEAMLKEQMKLFEKEVFAKKKVKKAKKTPGPSADEPGA
jgi:integrase/recombinase XerD